MVNKSLDKNIDNIKLGKSTLTLLIPGGQVNVDIDFEKQLLN
tara:strand:+ start:429 stop:554 length:126 start_codon:yes stop_codon:yes gene_type:complete